MRRIPFVLFLGALLLVACGREKREAPAGSTLQQDLPIFIISIDTLRSDHLSVYGYRGASQPAIEALRKESILYTAAFSQGPQTLVAHASLFTGLLPPHHGVRDNIGYVLPEAHPTLASALKASGYATGASVSSYVLRRSTSIGRGFDFFDDSLDFQNARVKTLAERDGDRARQSLEQWISQQSGRKLFGFLHLYEPHAPYEAPAQFAKSSNRYDNEISYADAIVGRFIATLKERGLYDDALIILLSDHGEGLGDHGEDEHGVFLYREAIQVPLMVKLPRADRAGETYAAPVGLMDVMPAVLSQAGIAQPKSDGRSLLDAPEPGRSIYAETWFPRLHFGWHELRSAVDSAHHYIEAPVRELYEWKSDPGERSNVASAKRRELFALTKALEAIPPQFTPPSEVDPEDQRKLAALGYLGSAPSQASLADPKSKVETLRALRKGFDLVQQRKAAQAVPLLQKFVEENPEIVDGWTLLGEALALVGQLDASAAAFKSGLKRFPGNSELILHVAEVLIRQKKFDEARQHLELTVDQNPVLGREFLARIALEQGDAAGAARELEQALNAAPERTETLKMLADVMQRMGRREDQLRYLDRTREQLRSKNMPPIAGLNFQRGEALLTLGKVREAEVAFREEVTAFPANRQAWANLAVIIGAQGRRDEARATLREALGRNRDRKMFDTAVEALSAMGDEQGITELRSQFGGRL